MSILLFFFHANISFDHDVHVFEEIFSANITVAINCVLPVNSNFLLVLREMGRVGQVRHGILTALNNLLVVFPLYFHREIRKKILNISFWS